MKILVLSSLSKSLINFRGPLIQSFVDKGHEVIAAGPDYNAYVNDVLSRMGVQYEIYHLQRTGTNLLSDIKSYNSLKKLINKVQPDLVLSYTIKPVIYGSYAAKRLKVPKIYSMITGLGNAFNNTTSLKSSYLSCITEFLYKASLKNTDGVIFQNPDDRDVFVEKDIIQKGKAFRIYGSGVDIDEFAFSEPVFNPVTFLFIGRLLKEKGINDFIEAARIIRKKYSDTRFLVVGGLDNNPTSYSISDFKEFHDSGLIEFIGRVKDVKPYIKQSSIFVLPSYYGEGTPRTGLEAMSMGRPLIMTDSVGCRETVKDGLNGFLVPIKNPNKIAQAMEKFIIDPNLITHMSKESRRFAEEVYDVSKVNKEICKILGL
ncbi:MAG: glycosyltransferase family 4 protein [Gracilimonas sp.]|uniref:glycosyltransferase family 4 protein n=1 Tax=Gracilimonas sp. TaxID=1974203 RepID=UPI00198DEE29|nr:glycosyltransferase family 4 protein [Gracilimonas sp.]MBD3614990.1 glycosyltransferase family 4 protein [Gracilimonas sp.]